MPCNIFDLLFFKNVAREIIYLALYAVGVLLIANYSPVCYTDGR